MGAPQTARSSFFRERSIVVEIESKVVMRQATAQEAWDLAELRVASLVEMGLLEPSQAPSFIRRAASELFGLFREERLMAWLLVVDEKPAGCACVVFWNRLPYPTTSLHAEIGGVYVVPELRRRGFATELVREALASTRGRGIRKVALSTTAAARPIYARLGFKDEAQMVMRAPH